MKDPENVQKVISISDHYIDSKKVFSLIFDYQKVDCKTAVNRQNESIPNPILQPESATRKIFVGGLHYDLTPADLEKHFSKYGKVTDCVIMKDRDSGKSRGFGFVSFESEDTVEKVLSAGKEHILLDKWIDCKRATNRTSNFTPRPTGPYTYATTYYTPQTSFPMPGKVYEPIMGSDQNISAPSYSYPMPPYMNYPPPNMSYPQNPYMQPNYPPPYYSQPYPYYQNPIGCIFLI